MKDLICGCGGKIVINKDVIYCEKCGINKDCRDYSEAEAIASFKKATRCDVVEKMEFILDTIKWCGICAEEKRDALQAIEMYAKQALNIKEDK